MYFCTAIGVLLAITTQLCYSVMQFESNWQRETTEVAVAFSFILVAIFIDKLSWKSSENINLSSIVHHRCKCWRNASLRIGDGSELSSKKTKKKVDLIKINIE